MVRFSFPATGFAAELLLGGPQARAQKKKKKKKKKKPTAEKKSEWESATHVDHVHRVLHVAPAGGEVPQDPRPEETVRHRPAP